MSYRLAKSRGNSCKEGLGTTGLVAQDLESFSTSTTDDILRATDKKRAPFPAPFLIEALFFYFLPQLRGCGAES
jgi:hypothetical protein